MRRWFLSPAMSKTTLFAVLSFFHFLGIVDLSAQSDVSVQILAETYLPAAVQTAVAVVVSNAGPATVSGLRLTNDLPAGTTFVSNDGAASCSVVGISVICDLGTVAANQALNINLYIQHNQVEDVLMRSTVNVPVSDSNLGNNGASSLLRFVPLLQANDVTVTERPGGTNATFVFQFSAPSPTPISISIGVTGLSATAGSDFTIPATTQLSFAAGVTQQTYAVTVLDDPYFEPVQAFKVTVSSAVDARVLIDRGDFFGLILDNDPSPTLSISVPASISEAAGTLTDQGVVRL